MKLKNKANAIFVTGTGTGVGKTYMTALLARTLREGGVDVGVMKPFASGDLSDAQELKAAAQSNDAISLITPFFCRAPLAPAVAAALERKTIPWKTLDAAFQRLQKKHELLLVEGIGGARVPLDDRHCVGDLVARWKLPALVVASAKLGTLNHTLLTLDYLRSKKIPLLAVVLNFFDAQELCDRENFAYFRRKKIPCFVLENCGQ